MRVKVKIRSGCINITFKQKSCKQLIAQFIVRHVLLYLIKRILQNILKYICEFFPLKCKTHTNPNIKMPLLYQECQRSTEMSFCPHNQMLQDFRYSGNISMCQFLFAKKYR